MKKITVRVLLVTFVLLLALVALSYSIGSYNVSSNTKSIYYFGVRFLMFCVVVVSSTYIIYKYEKYNEKNN